METRLLKMGDELSRLSAFEAECHRKDKVIEELRDEIARFRVDEETLRQSQELEKVNAHLLIKYYIFIDGGC